MTVRVRIAGVDYPPTLSTGDVATGFFDCSPEFLQRQRGQGTLPVEPLLLGNRLRWPTIEVAKAVGLPFEVVDDESAAEMPAGAVAR